MLDSNGFNKPSYDEILQKVIAKMQETFGSDIDVTSTGRFGIIARMMAWLSYKDNSLAEDVYNSAFVTKANGVSLDRLGGNYGITRIPASIAYVDLTITGEPDFVVPALSQFKTIDNYLFFTTNDVILKDGTATVLAYSSEPGEQYNVAANTIKLQVQPVDDIHTVTNQRAAEGGANNETDSSLRNRMLNATKGVNSATENGLISSLEATTGVKAVKLVANNTDQTDAAGTPPHTVHFYLLGGLPTDIANVIFKNIAFGIQTIGKQAVKVLDSSAHEHTVFFDYAQEKPVWVQIKISVNETFASDGIDQVKEQVKSYFSQLTMGDSIIYTRLYKFIYDNVDGVTDAEVKLSSDGKVFAPVNIASADFEIPAYAADHVTVTEA